MTQPGRTTAANARLLAALAALAVTAPHAAAGACVRPGPTSDGIRTVVVTGAAGSVGRTKFIGTIPYIGYPRRYKGYPAASWHCAGLRHRSYRSIGLDLAHHNRGFCRHGCRSGRTAAPGPTIAEIARATDPALLGLPSQALQNPTPPTPPTPHEAAVDALGDHRFADAAAHFADALDALPENNPRRATTERLRAYALAAHGRHPSAQTVLRRLYDQHPDLGERPIPAITLLGDSMAARAVTSDAVAHAHALRDPAHKADAWFMVAVLMQAEGRHHQARRMLDRAERPTPPAEPVAAAPPADDNPPSSDPPPRSP